MLLPTVIGVLLLAVATVGQVRWQSEHHDNQNTRNTQFVGPGSTNGTCMDVMVGIDQDKEPGVFVASSGVLGLEGALYFVGDSDNNLRCIDDGEVEREFIIDLDILYEEKAHDSAPFAVYGITSSPIVFRAIDYFDDDYDFDRLVVGTSNGLIFSFHLGECKEGQVDEIVCYEWYNQIWSSVIGSRHGFIGPPAWNNPEKARDQFNSGLVYIPSTHIDLDTGGRLRAYDSEFGYSVFSIRTIDKDGEWWGLRTAAAIDKTRSGLIYIAFGREVHAIHPTSGKTITKIDASDFIKQTISASEYKEGEPAADIFVSSPVLLSDGSGLIIQSAFGYIWKIKISGKFELLDDEARRMRRASEERNNDDEEEEDPDDDDDEPGDDDEFGPDIPYTSTVKFTIAWACDYLDADNQCVNSNTKRLHRVIAGRNGEGDRILYADELVPGGLPAPSTRQDVEAVHSRFREKYAIKLAQEANYDLTAPLPESILKTVNNLHIETVTGKFNGPEIAEIAKELGYHESTYRSGGLLPVSMYPYPTCALANNKNVICSVVHIHKEKEYNLLVEINVTTGQYNWEKSYVISEEGFSLLGRGYSSPLVDGQGNVYVATDAPPYVGNNDTIPTLWAFSSKGDYQWKRDIENAMGEGMGLDDTIGYASPLIGPGSHGGARLFLPAKEGVIAFGHGVSCPGNCGNIHKGYCNCDTGECTCRGCYGGDDCALECGGHGHCTEDGCVCQNCWTKDDKGLCTIPLDCGDGKCNESTGKCYCPSCSVFDEDTKKCVPQDCGNGFCSFGVCVCDNCWALNDDKLCLKKQDCGGMGICIVETGICDCYDSCDYGNSCQYKTDCHAGKCIGRNKCTCPEFFVDQYCTLCDTCHSFDKSTNSCVALDPDPCSGHGKCVPHDRYPTCKCDEGWIGSTCSDVPPPPDKNANNVPKVVAGVSIPLLLIGLCVGGVFLMKKKGYNLYSIIGNRYQKIGVPGVHPKIIEGASQNPQYSTQREIASSQFTLSDRARTGEGAGEAMAKLSSIKFSSSSSEKTSILKGASAKTYS